MYNKLNFQLTLKTPFGFVLCSNFGFCKGLAVEKRTETLFQMHWKPRNEQNKIGSFSLNGKSQELGNLVLGHFWRKIHTFFRIKMFQIICQKLVALWRKTDLNEYQVHYIHA